MRLRERMSISAAPIPLRLALAAVFIYAGLAKILPQDQFSGADASALQAIGVAGDPGPGPSTPISKPPEEAPPPAPAQEEPADTQKPADPGAEPATAPEPQAPEATPPTEPLPEPGAPPNPGAGVRVLMVADAETGEPAEAEPISAARVHAITLMLVRASDHGPDMRPLLPEFCGRGRTPVYLARAAAWTELVGGLLVLIGLLTRLSALSLCGVIAMAIWLTSIGPAAVGGAPASLWIFPANDGFNNFAAYQTFLMQVICLGALAALFFAGAGALSVDRLFGEAPGEAPARAHADARARTP